MHAAAMPADCQAENVLCFVHVFFWAEGIRNGHRAHEDLKNWCHHDLCLRTRATDRPATTTTCFNHPFSRTLEKQKTYACATHFFNGKCLELGYFIFLTRNVTLSHRLNSDLDMFKKVTYFRQGERNTRMTKTNDVRQSGVPEKKLFLFTK